MSATATPPPRSPQFTQDELAMLSKTADALSAYLGKPVLAEVGQSDAGTEWVTFGVPIDEQAEPDEAHAHVQLGGPASRLLGNRGGLPMSDNVTYDCAYLWAIEISVTADERFVKLGLVGRLDRCAAVRPERRRSARRRGRRRRGR